MTSLTPRHLVDKAGGVQNAASLLSVTRGTIYNWLRAGKIPAKLLPYVLQKMSGK